jgi:hypothetical protein
MSTPFVVAAISYALIFGAGELSNLRVRPPTSTWQVPSEWIKGRSKLTQILVWATTLGPGIATRNPFAGMWLPLLVIGLGGPESGLLVGSLAGAAHGTMRAVGIVGNIHGDSRRHPSEMVLAELRWRRIDGALLTAASGFLIGIWA